MPNPPKNIFIYYVSKCIGWVGPGKYQFLLTYSGWDNFLSFIFMHLLSAEDHEINKKLLVSQIRRRRWKISISHTPMLYD